MTWPEATWNRQIDPPVEGLCLWLTGLSGSGKSTLAFMLAEKLSESGQVVEILDGDVIRTQLSADLGFSKQDRDTHISRLAWVASRLVRARAIAIVAAISPYTDARQDARARIERYGRFLEIYLAAPLAICEARDPKGLYRRARSGELNNFTGVDAPYEVPHSPDLVLPTGIQSPEESLSAILDLIATK